MLDEGFHNMVESIPGAEVFSFMQIYDTTISMQQQNNDENNNSMYQDNAMVESATQLLFWQASGMKPGSQAMMGAIANLPTVNSSPIRNTAVGLRLTGSVWGPKKCELNTTCNELLCITSSYCQLLGPAN
jgi:hypothetical protein